MPKEIAHFVMARMAGQALPEASLFHGALQRFPRLFTFGAVVPDINFYCLTGPGKKAVQALSEPFHRSGRQALLPVLEFLESRGSSPKALALACGVICHIMADTAFHPLVCYYAGLEGVHAGATARHRRFETAMDLYFWHLDPQCPIRLRRFSAALEISKNDLIPLLAALFRTGRGRDIKRAMNWHAGIQHLFFAPWIKRVIVGMKALGLPLPGIATGLVYPFKRPAALPFFSEPIPFFDPCTREKREMTAAQLARNAVTDTVRVIELAGRFMAEKKPVSGLLDHPDLPRIRPGLPLCRSGLWRKEADITPRVYRGYLPPF